jgi:hypothetical protein
MRDAMTTGSRPTGLDFDRAAQDWADLGRRVLAAAARATVRTMQDRGLRDETIDPEAQRPSPE